MRTIAIILAAAALTGCAGKPPTLHEGADQVQVAKNDPPAGSVYLQEISAQDGEGCGGFGYKGSYPNAVTRLRNEALRVGADFVQIINLDTPNLEYGCYDNTYRIDATAYRTANAPPSYEQKVYRLGLQPAAQAQSSPGAQSLGQGGGGATGDGGGLTREQWKTQQLDQLNRETGLSYEEYQRRYREIVGQ